jgi:serine/threonine protein kinase
MNDEQIFHQALARSRPEERAAYLEQACAGNPALRASVEALLRANEGASGFLSEPAVELGATIDVPSRESRGTIIGPFKLLQQLGDGGMGSVFMAEQAQPVQRKVALKIIKPGMDSRQVVARFEAERQALALMEHPNIAKVFDAGTTESGRPYFVMELVKGVPITRYCDEHCLTPRPRLELFVPVCQAVQHAHQKGVIHRDLKPSNVLVAEYDDEPVAKVIDFGVAKATGPRLTERTMFTEVGQIVGTLEYMSPEQAKLNQLDVDTRSDIYSLGVLLYELLTGTTPLEKIRFRRTPIDELLRAIREEEPPKPSTRLSTTEELPAIAAHRGLEPKKLSGLVRGDLDWIVMRALAKDRNERYATAKELSDDLERFLDNRPVLARPPTLRDRLRKWARRHKALVRSGAALVALAVAALGVGTVLLNAKNKQLALANSQEQEARAQADTNFEFAKAGVNEFLNRVAEDRSLQMRAELYPLRKKLLSAAAPFLEKLARQKPGTDALEAQRAWAYGRLGVVRQQMGELERALADIEEMRAILDRLAHKHPDQAAYRRDLAQAHTNRGTVLHQLHRPEEALAAFGQAQTLWAGLAAGGSLNDPELAKNHIDRGNALQDLGRDEEAVADYHTAAAILDKLSPEHRSEQGAVSNNLGNALRHLRRPEEALAALSQAAKIRGDLLAEAPDDPVLEADMAATQIGLGQVLQDLNRPEESLAAFEKVLASMEPLADRMPTVPRPREYMAMAYNGIVYLFAKQGKVEEALTYSQKGLAAQEKLVADFPKVPQYRTELATAYMNRGAQLARLGRNEEALAPFQKALALHEALAKDYPSVLRHAEELGGSYCNMGAVLNDLGRPEEALTWLAKSIVTLEKLLPSVPRSGIVRLFLCNGLVTRAEALAKLQRYSEAVHDWDRAIALGEGPRRAQFRLDRAATLARAGQHAQAVAEADALAGVKAPSPQLLYGAACVFALASAAPDDARLRERYAARAVELLGSAIDRGFKDAGWVQKDHDLDRLRPREDFQKQVRRIAPKDKP